MTHGPVKTCRDLQLFCFPYAGGSARIYQEWAGQLPQIQVQGVQLPGRAERFHEPAIAQLGQLLPQLLAQVVRQARAPFAFFGHSMGALLAFEVARELRRLGLPQPQHLFVSGCAAPQMRPQRESLHTLPDQALVAKLSEYNGTPAEVLADPELMALLLPMLRADFCLVETYRYVPAAPLNVPITVLAGLRDPYVTADQADGWQRETLVECAVHQIDGDHFFIHSRQAQVLALLRNELGTYLNEG